MSDRPTPETDALSFRFIDGAGVECEAVPSEFVRLLERERDILRSNKMSDPLLETTFKHLNRERDEACQVANGLAKQVERLRKERDEAIARSKEWSDWCVEYKSERDEARTELANLESLMFGGLVQPAPKNALAWRVFDAVMAMKKERDEARAERDILRLNSLGTIQLNIPVTTDWKEDAK